VSLTQQLLTTFKQSIAELTLLPSDGGRFEVKIDGDLVYSKLATGSFPDASTIEAEARKRH
jgi:selenoprotein W-related protein